MELSEVANIQFAVPVIGVVVCAVLVFAFGFKSPGQPSFDALYDDDRKSKRIRNRRTGIHGDKHKNATSTTSASDDDDETTAGQQPASKPVQDSSRHQPNGVTGVSSSGRAYSGVGGADAASRSQAKVVKSEEPVEIIPKEDRVSVGGWTTAVSKKDKKNRSKKDESVKHDKPSVQTDKLKPTFPTLRDSRSVKNNKKLSELTTVTVVVPGPPSSNRSVTETSTTITETAVIKVKVVPSVRVSVNTHQTPNGHAVMDKKSLQKPPAPVVSVALPVGGSRGATVAPWAKLDGDSSKSDKPALILGFDDWTEVQSSRSPKKKRGNIDESQEKLKDASASVADHSDTMYNQLPLHSSTSAAEDKAGLPKSSAAEPAINVDSVSDSPSDYNGIRDSGSARDNSSSSSSPTSKVQSLKKETSDSSTSALTGGAETLATGGGHRDGSIGNEVLRTNDENADDSPATEESEDWQEAKTVKKKKRNSKTSVGHEEN